jgi:hypothetical protein
MNVIAQVLAGFMVIMSLVLAFFLIFTDLMADSLFGNKRIVLSVILIAYAVYRSYRLYVTVKR